MMGSSTVTLSNNSGLVLDTFTMNGLYDDVSFGRCQESCSGREYDYFNLGTPGAVNASANRVKVVSPPYMSLSVADATDMGAYTANGETIAYSVSDYGTDTKQDITESTDLFTAAYDWRDHPTHSYSGPSDRATRTAEYDGGTSHTVTPVVGWLANQSSMRVVGRPLKFNGVQIRTILNQGGLDADDRVRLGLGGTLDGGIYFVLTGTSDIYRTTDGFETAEIVGVNPRNAFYSGSAAEDPGTRDVIFRTPLGDFYAAIDIPGDWDRVTLFRSTDGMQTWTVQTVNGGLATETDKRVVNSGIDWHYDEDSGELYVALFEYVSPALDETVSIYFGTWDSSTTVGDLVKVHTFGSENSDLFDAVKHGHTARFDPYTGDLWVISGDSVVEVKKIVCYSDCDDYSNYTLFATRNQEDRSLSHWFTENAMYSNVDSSSTEYIQRWDRSNIVNGEWIPIATEYVEGDTPPEGIKVIIKTKGTAAFDAMTATCGACLDGDEGTVTASMTLGAGDSCVASSVPSTDYRERYRIDDTSQWYSGTYSIPGGFVEIMSSSNAEGASVQRDDYGRLFAIHERSDGVDIQEVYVDSIGVAGPNDNFEPAGQDASGRIYFRDPNSGQAPPNDTTFYVMELDWTPSESPMTPID
jgi:hypothetical protein